jgi:hypothetical protein
MRVISGQGSDAESVRFKAVLLLLDRRKCLGLMRLGVIAFVDTGAGGVRQERDHSK